MDSLASSLTVQQPTFIVISVSVLTTSVIVPTDESNRRRLPDLATPAEVLERDLQGNVYSASRLLRSRSPGGIDAARGHRSRRVGVCAFRSRHRSPSLVGAWSWAGRLTAELMKIML